MPIIAVAGGSGHLGRAIAEALVAEGKYQLLILARSVCRMTCASLLYDTYLLNPLGRRGKAESHRSHLHSRRLHQCRLPRQGPRREQGRYRHFHYQCNGRFPTRAEPDQGCG